MTIRKTRNSVVLDHDNSEIEVGIENRCYEQVLYIKIDDFDDDAYVVMKLEEAEEFIKEVQQMIEKLKEAKC